MKEGIINASSGLLEIIISDVFIKNGIDEEDAVIIAIIHSLIEKSRDVHLLLKFHRFGSIDVIGRTMLELYISLLFILEKDTKRRARAYMFSYKKQAAEKIKKTLETLPDAESILDFTDSELQELDKEVKGAKTLKDYSSSYSEKYNKVFSEGIKNRKNWYNLDGNINNFKDLMMYVGHNEYEYSFFYGIGSLDVHGISTIGKMTIENGVFGMKKISTLPFSEYFISTYLIMGILKMYEYYKKRMTNKGRREARARQEHLFLSFKLLKENLRL